MCVCVCCCLPVGTQFLLEIEELAGLTQHLEPWRRDVYAPLIIEVRQRTADMGRYPVATPALGRGLCASSVLSQSHHKPLKE